MKTLFEKAAQALMDATRYGAGDWSQLASELLAENWTAVPSNRREGFLDGSLAEALLSVPGTERASLQTMVGRCLEEAVELCLASGMSVGEIQNHVHDSIFNQFLKEGSRLKKTCFPSQGLEQANATPYAKAQAVLGELADLLIQIEYIHHRLSEFVSEGIEIPSLVDAYNSKAAEIVSSILEGEFHAATSGNLYRKKPHVVGC